MIVNRGRVGCSLAVLFSLCLAGRLTAQMNPILRFKKVPISVDLRIKDSILPKGVYDLEFLRTPSPLSYYLRIMKEGKILHLIQGEFSAYDDPKKVPKKPMLNMSKDTAEKLLIIVFESGSFATKYAKLRVRYQIPYE